MQRILSSGALVEVVPYQATAVEEFEDGSLSAEDEEQMALLRLNNEYFRVVENTMDRLVLHNRPFWFSTCVGIFFLMLSSVLVLPFFVIIWSATWDIVIFDRPRDLVTYRRRYLCGTFKTVQREKLSAFDGFVAEPGYVSSRLSALFKSNRTIPLTNGMSEVPEERETVLRITKRWLQRETGGDVERGSGGSFHRSSPSRQSSGPSPSRFASQSISSSSSSHLGGHATSPSPVPSSLLSPSNPSSTTSPSAALSPSSSTLVDTIRSPPPTTSSIPPRAATTGSSSPSIAASGGIEGITSNVNNTVGVTSAHSIVSKLKYASSTTTSTLSTFSNGTSNNNMVISPIPINDNGNNTTNSNHTQSHTRPPVIAQGDKVYALCSNDSSEWHEATVEEVLPNHQFILHFIQLEKKEEVGLESINFESKNGPSSCPEF